MDKEPMGGKKGGSVNVGVRRKYEKNAHDDIAQEVASKLSKHGRRDGDDQAYTGGKHQGICYTHHNESKTGYDD